VLQKLSELLNRICEWALILVLAVMAVVVFLQVLFRYLIHLPLFWTEEFARYCLVWASLLGSAVAVKRGEHLAVTFFLDQFPMRWGRIVILAAQSAVIVILFVMLWGGAKLVVVTSTQITPALRIPMAIPYLALPIGSTVMLVHVISSILNKPEDNLRDPS
jgi:TRAP-type C4-dicarboxylate transport system permease small subunit